jgi:hypothetical protein
MGDKKKAEKKLAITKETVQELSESELDQVAGGQGPIGPTGPTAGKGVTATGDCQRDAQKITGHCN